MLMKNDHYKIFLVLIIKFIEMMSFTNKLRSSLCNSELSKFLYLYASLDFKVKFQNFCFEIKKNVTFVKLG